MTANALRAAYLHKTHGVCTRHDAHGTRALPCTQVVPPELLYAPSGDAVNFTQTYCSDYTYNEYNEPLRRRFRAAAHTVLAAPPLRTALCCTLDALPSAPHLLQVLGDRAALVRPQLRRRARAEWRRWRRVSSRILGVHVRGTDKTVAPRVAQRGQSNSLGTGWPSPAPALSRGLGGDGSGQHARYSQRERGRDRSTGRAQSLPRVLQRVASRVTDSPVPGH